MNNASAGVKELLWKAWNHEPKNNSEWQKFIKENIDEEAEQPKEDVQDLGVNNNINACPFCGGKEGVSVFLGYEYPKYRITCVPCNVVMKDDRKDKVIANWNHSKEQGITDEEIQVIAEKEFVYKMTENDGNSAKYLGRQGFIKGYKAAIKSQPDKIRCETVSKEEYEHAINQIGQLQEQLNEAEQYIRDLQK